MGETSKAEKVFRAVEPSYATALLSKMRELGVTKKQLAEATRYSYEQVRKVLAGKPVVSRHLNEALCRHLGLDVANMWERAMWEKAHKRFPPSVMEYLELPHTPESPNLWDRLTATNRKKALDYVKRLVELQDLEQHTNRLK